MNVFFSRVNQQIGVWVERWEFGNLDDFVSEALFVPLFERYIFLRCPSLFIWCLVWFSDQITGLLHYLSNRVCYML